MKYIVSFSGGKDSTAMLLRLLEEKKPVDDIVFCDTGKEFPDLIKHIKKVEDYIKRPITILRAEKTFDYYFLEQQRDGSEKYKQIKGYGWSSAKRRWCTTLLKTQIFKKYVKQYDDDYRIYIGFAYDENKRIIRDNNKHHIFPLNEWKMTEADCLQYCYDRGFDWNGLYKHFDRVSCYLCPLQSKKNWLTLEKNYPELFADAIRLDRQSCYKFSPKETLEERIKRWHKYEEDDKKQLNLLD